MKRIWNLLVILVALLAIFGTFGLVSDEFQIGNICPKIVGIPACYIVLFCFTTALLSHVISFKSNRTIYFIATGLVTTIALFGTFGELLGFAECPRTSSGIPMCFISLAICIGLISFKLLDIKSNS